MAKSKTKQTISSLDVYKRIRKDWNGVNPVQKVVPNKKKYTRKTKYKKDYSME